MEQWIRQTMEIETPFSYEGPEEHIVVGKVLIPLGLFLEHYGHLSAPPTLTDLVTVDPENVRGWNGYFELWRDAGLIAD